MGALATTGSAARGRAGPRRRPARPPPPGRLAQPARAGPGGGLQPHHGVRPSSPPPGSRPGASWSCSSRPWTATSKSSARCGWPPSTPDGARPGRAADRGPRGRSWPPSAATSRRGTGLLLVTGEAGMGKTRLVTTAAARCRDHLRHGRVVPAAVAPRCPCCRSPTCCGRPTTRRRPVAQGGPRRLRAVRRRLAAAAPPRARPRARRPARAGGRVVTATAVRGRRGDPGSTGVASRRSPCCVEDLHWADSATLDLHRAPARPPGRRPVLGTWRLDDPATPEHTASGGRGCSGCRRSTTLALRPLSRDETAEQLEMLAAGRVDPDLVDRIHRRSQGQPLFTEQLAGHDDGQRPAPAPRRPARPALTASARRPGRSPARSGSPTGR